jgi:transcription elongation factor Elf1
MRMMPLGDYYVWYCEWCDSRNLTLWTRREKGEVFCGACHNRHPMTVPSHAGMKQTFSRVI